MLVITVWSPITDAIYIGCIALYCITLHYVLLCHILLRFTVLFIISNTFVYYSCKNHYSINTEATIIVLFLCSSLHCMYAYMQQEAFVPCCMKDTFTGEV